MTSQGMTSLKGGKRGGEGGKRGGASNRNTRRGSSVLGRLSP